MVRNPKGSCFRIFLLLNDHIWIMCVCVTHQGLFGVGLVKYLGNIQANMDFPDPGA